MGMELACPMSIGETNRNETQEQNGGDETERARREHDAPPRQGVPGAEIGAGLLRTSPGREFPPIHPSLGASRPMRYCGCFIQRAARHAGYPKMFAGTGYYGMVPHVNKIVPSFGAMIDDLRMGR